VDNKNKPESEKTEETESKEKSKEVKGSQRKSKNLK